MHKPQIPISILINVLTFSFSLGFFYRSYVANKHLLLKIETLNEQFHDLQDQKRVEPIKLLEYNRFSQVFKALVEYSKYSKWENFGQLGSGHILLQDHGDRVSFKNIKIREF